MRILAYNIWDGGGDRLDVIADVIRGVDPDAVALVEATVESASTLAADLGFELSFGEVDGLFDLHLAWLSRLPIRRARNHQLRELSKTLLEIQVAGIRLFATHLASRHEEHAHPRVEEVRAILRILERVHGPHLLVGDFNALQPGEAVGKPPPGVVPRGDALPDADRIVLSPLAHAGYVDCFRALTGEPGYTYTAQTPWLRLDYAFASHDVAPRVSSCAVITGDLAARASDHLPVVVEVEPLEPGAVDSPHSRS